MMRGQLQRMVLALVMGSSRVDMCESITTTTNEVLRIQVTGSRVLNYLEKESLNALILAAVSHLTPVPAKMAMGALIVERLFVDTNKRMVK